MAAAISCARAGSTPRFTSRLNRSSCGAELMLNLAVSGMISTTVWPSGKSNAKKGTGGLKRGLSGCVRPQSMYRIARRRPPMARSWLRSPSTAVDVLTPTGRFVFADVVVPVDPADARIPLSERYDQPSPLADQLAWLADSGFDARTVWERADLAVVAADPAH